MPFDLRQTGGGGPALPSVPTLGTPAYFFPNQFIFDNFDGTNVDPTTANTTNGVVRWNFFYLPFNITISRYRFQMDGVGVGGIFYAGLYTSLGSLICDIGGVPLTAIGQFGKGAAHDPGTNLFDSGGNATNSIALTAGWLIYGWAGSVTSGAGLTVPSMQPLNNTVYGEQIIADTVGLPAGILGRSGTNTAGVSGGHMPSTIALAGVASNQANSCCNITFFA